MRERLKFAILLLLMITGLVFIWYTHHNVDENFVKSFGLLM